MSAHQIGAWMFPGQGSQYLGMGRDFWSAPGRALEIVEEAERLSGFPLRSISLQGPDEQLKRTDVLQPALTAVSLACIDLLKSAGYRPEMAAGHSLGEFAALSAAGVLSIEDCLKLVAERGRLMQAAAEKLHGGMGAVKRLSFEELSALIAANDAEISIANFNSPDQIAVSGTLTALQSLSSKVTAAGGEFVPLSVAGPWHSPVMAEAAEAFAAALNDVAFSAPECPVFMNVSGQEETGAERIKALVREQMTAPVLWKATVEAMFGAGAHLFLEVGPGKVLRGLLRRILPDESLYRVRGIENKRGLDILRREIAA